MCTANDRQRKAGSRERVTKRRPGLDHRIGHTMLFEVD
jgi:hypothetical protein